ncbi:MAG: class I SAM-dependent methyltransferase [Acidobacteria bacterium]|nr:class I SAM-dependent methyltransferase [Acidobacteriota bacterium]
MLAGAGLVLLIPWAGVIRVASILLIGPAVQDHLDRDARNIERARQRMALEESAKFVDEYMSQARSFPDKLALLRHSLAAVDPALGGSYCEFGVYTGGTINFIAEAVPDREIHGFDSFEGLPENWRDKFGKGSFKLDRLPQVRKNVVLHKGWFDRTVPRFHRENLRPVAFMHMDADLYSSTKMVFDALADRIVPGTVIQFDEFMNYPGWRQGEYKAFLELIASRNLTFEYLGYCRFHEQVAVKIASAGAARVQ